MAKGIEQYYPKVAQAAESVMQFMAESSDDDMVGLGGAIAISPGYILTTDHQIDSRDMFTLYYRTDSTVHPYTFKPTDFICWESPVDIAFSTLPNRLRSKFSLLKTKILKPEKISKPFFIGFPSDMEQEWNAMRLPRIIPITLSHWTSFDIEFSFDKTIADAHGASGGALVNEHGDLFAVVSQELRTSVFQAINVAVFQHEFIK